MSAGINNLKIQLIIGLVRISCA